MDRKLGYKRTDLARECEFNISVGLLCPLWKHLQNVGVQHVVLAKIRGLYKGN